MDIWAEVLSRVPGQGRPNWANVGRWFAHLSRGKLFHDDINRAQAVRGELPLGWAVHYGVGIIYGVIFALIAGASWLAAPGFLPVWIFGIVTIAAGWFLLQPGMGLGWALSKTDAAWSGRVKGLIAHTVFALGMWIVALLIG
jgi:hypothetical protein